MDRDRDRGRRSVKRPRGRQGEAKCTGWTKFYKGEITRVNSDDTYDIKFEDGERKRGVRKDQVRSLDGGGSDRDRGSSSSSSSRLREGDKVEAKCTGWTKFYKGEITRVNSDDTYDIKFEDGERKRGVRKDQVRSLDGGGSDRDRGSSSSSSSRLREGDKVEAKCTGWTKFYKGEITRVNSDDTYDIKFEDGERKRGVRKDQVRSLDGGGSDRDRGSSIVFVQPSSRRRQG